MRITTTGLGGYVDYAYLGGDSYLVSAEISDQGREVFGTVCYWRKRLNFSGRCKMCECVNPRCKRAV